MRPGRRGPHLVRRDGRYYLLLVVRRDGRYYLLLAEGKTEFHHAVTVARSEPVTGPYRNNPGNPLLTHGIPAGPNRSSGRGMRTWSRPWTVAGTPCYWPCGPAAGPSPTWAGKRSWPRSPGRMADRGHPGGWLTEVTREDDWPVINPGAGRLRAEFPAPLPAAPWTPEPPLDDFDAAAPGAAWSMLRTPRAETFSRTAPPGHLRLRPRPEAITEPCHPSSVGRACST